MLLDILRVEVAHLGVDAGAAYFLWIKTDMVDGAERETPAFTTCARPCRPRSARPTPWARPPRPSPAACTSARPAVFTPGWLRHVWPARMPLRTRTGERDARGGARDGPADAERGARRRFDAARRRTAASEAAAASAGHHLRTA